MKNSEMERLHDKIKKLEKLVEINDCTLEYRQRKFTPTKITGAYNFDSNNIVVSPYIGIKQIPGTLIHEFTHHLDCTIFKRDMRNLPKKAWKYTPTSRDRHLYYKDSKHESLAYYVSGEICEAFDFQNKNAMKYYNAPISKSERKKADAIVGYVSDMLRRRGMLCTFKKSIQYRGVK